MTRWICTAASALLAVMTPAPAWAQQPDEPKVWTVEASAGFAFTSGNTDTSTLNAAYDVVWDPQTRNVVKSDGLALRSVTEGTVSSNRLSLNVRDEYRVNGKFFVFAQNQYLRDEFKDIEHLVAPTGGLGYQMIDTAATQLGVDVSAGGVWEQNLEGGLNASGAVTLGQRFSRRLTETTTLTQTFKGLWKTEDFDDALYAFGASVSASISTRTQLKVEVLDTFKNAPRLATTVKNDVAVLMAIVFKT